MRKHSLKVMTLVAALPTAVATQAETLSLR